MSMTLRRFAYAMRFTCIRCNLLKTSKFRAETPEGVVCNGCYGKKLTEATR
jgi:transcription elongation factor Elf1